MEGIDVSKLGAMEKGFYGEFTKTFDAELLPALRTQVEKDHPGATAAEVERLIEEQKLQLTKAALEGIRQGTQSAIDEVVSSGLQSGIQRALVEGASERPGGGLIALGYVLALLGGWFGFALGLYLWRSKVSIGGISARRFDAQAQLQGKIILAVAAVSWIFWISMAGGAK